MFPDKPGIPRDLAASEITSTSATLSWSPPKSDGGSPITNYVVEKSTSFSPRWVRATKAAIPECSAVLTDLVEGTAYQFRVLAENEAGPGLPCEPIGPMEAKEPYG